MSESKRKTLEELRKGYVEDKSRLDQGDYSCEVFCDYLKSEAKKWLDKLSYSKDTDDIVAMNGWSYEDRDSMCAFIEHFFNIKDEEIK